MRITEDFIEKGRSSNGGWNKAQMKALGVTIFVKGWKSGLIGKEINETQAAEFLALKDLHINNNPKLKERLKKKPQCFEPVTSDTPYKDQYKHPNWQKMRLMVLNRDNFKCINCGNKHKMLHAHHLKYNRKGYIWDVPIWYLVTLCEDCHSEEHGRDLKYK